VTFRYGVGIIRIAITTTTRKASRKICRNERSSKSAQCRIIGWRVTFFLPLVIICYTLFFVAGIGWSLTCTNNNRRDHFSCSGWVLRYGKECGSDGLTIVITDRFDRCHVPWKENVVYFVGCSYCFFGYRIITVIVIVIVIDCLERRTVLEGIGVDCFDGLWKFDGF